MTDPYTVGTLIIVGVAVITAVGGMWARSQVGRNR